VRDIKRIILHCTATEEGQHVTVDDVRRWHTMPKEKGGRGWRDIGYHYLIYIDGTIMQGRPLHLQGAHVRGHNADSIGIAYVGGLYDDEPSDTMTSMQELAWLRLVSGLRTVFGDHLTVHGHNEFANKACPSFTVADKYKFLYIAANENENG